MPTIPTCRDQQPFTVLPDIFRTADGTNLGIGPQDRMRLAAGDGAREPGRDRLGAGTGVTPGRYPRIVLRDSLGYELDTFTTLQEAIYRARLKVKQSGHADTPLEWRLPKAPAPARPDLTRVCPPPKHPHVETEVEKMRKKGPYSNVLEFAVEDVGFVKESLQHLPYVPALSFLRHDILTGPKIYFQIVGTMLMHERILSLTEKRNAVYNFPGLCTGCSRLGLCYGCAKSSEPHTHMDKPVKTGGGFTYFKKDRPENEIASKNPVNWKIKHPDQALKKLMEEYGGVDLEGEIPEEIRRHLDQYGGHCETLRESRVPHPAQGQQPSHMPALGSEMLPTHKKRRTFPKVSEPGSDTGDARLCLPDIVAAGDDQVHDDLLQRHGDLSQHHGDLSQHHTGSSSQGRATAQQYRDVNFDLYDEMMDTAAQRDYEDEGELTDDQGHAGHYGNYPRSNAVSSRSRSEEAHSRKDVIDIEVGQRGSSYDRGIKRYSRQKQAVSDTEAVGEEDGAVSDDEKGSDRASRARKKQLYKPPPTFKLKKSPSRKIQARSPFSTDRKLNVPTGGTFELKKSKKPPTKFKAFRNVDASWKEPKKFELKENQAKPTKFWSGPRKNKEDDGSKKRSKKGSSSRGRGRSDSPVYSISPDSGLDSGLMTVMVSKKASWRPRHHSTRRVTPSASSTPGDESVSGESVSWPPLDSYSDTAAQYYSNKDLAAYTHPQQYSDQDESPRRRRGHRLHGLPPLRATPQEGPRSSRRAATRWRALARFQPRSSAISPILYQGDHPRQHSTDESDSEDNWRATARELERHYLAHVGSDTDESEGEPHQGHSSRHRPLPQQSQHQQRLKVPAANRSTKQHKYNTKDASRLHTDATRGRSHLLDRETERDSFLLSRDRAQVSNYPHERDRTQEERSSTSENRAPHGMFPPLRQRGYLNVDSSRNNRTELNNVPETRARKRHHSKQEQDDVRKMSRYVIVDDLSSDETESEEDDYLGNEAGGAAQQANSQPQQGYSDDDDYSGENVGLNRQMRATHKKKNRRQPDSRLISGYGDGSENDWPGRNYKSRESNVVYSPLEREQTYNTNISVKVTKNVKKTHLDNSVRNDRGRCGENHSRYTQANYRDTEDISEAMYKKNQDFEPDHVMYKESDHLKYKHAEENDVDAGDGNVRPKDSVKGYNLKSDAVVERFANLKKFMNIVKDNKQSSEDDNQWHNGDQYYNDEGRNSENPSKMRREIRYRQKSVRAACVNKEQLELDSDEFEHAQDGRQPNGEEYAVYRAIRKKKQKERSTPKHHRQGQNTTGDIDNLSDKLEEYPEERQNAVMHYQGEEDDGLDKTRKKYGRKHRKTYPCPQDSTQEDQQKSEYWKSKNIYNTIDEDDFDKLRKLYDDYDDRTEMEELLEHTKPPDYKMSRVRKKHKFIHSTSNADDHDHEYSTNSEGQLTRHRRKYKAMHLNTNEGNPLDYDQSYSKDDDTVHHLDENENQRPHRHKRRRKHRRRRDGSVEMDKEYLNQLSEMDEINNSIEADYGASNNSQHKQRDTSHNVQTSKKQEKSMVERDRSVETDSKKRSRKEKIKRRKEKKLSDNGNEHSLETPDNDHTTSNGRQRMRRRRKQYASRESTTLSINPNEGLSVNEEDQIVGHDRSQVHHKDKVVNPSRKSIRKSNLLQDRDRELTITTSKTSSFYYDSNDLVSFCDTDEGNDFENLERTIETPNDSKIKHMMPDRNKQQLDKGLERDPDQTGESHMKEAQAKHSFTAPPVIPGNIDFEKGSLTSHEPDLELVFDDVIDLENLEVVDDEDDEEEMRRAEEKRRRRHRHRRRKRREAEQATADKQEQADNSNKQKSGYETEKSSLFNPTGEGNVEQAVELVAKENTPLPYDIVCGSQQGVEEDSEGSGSETGDEDQDIPDTQGRQARTKHRNKRSRKPKSSNDRKNLSKDRGLERKISRQSKDRSLESRKSKQSNDMHFNDRKSQDWSLKERPSVDKKSKEKQTRHIAKGNLDTASKATKTGTTIRKEKQETRKRKAIIKIADEEEFVTLPSIKTQIAKIMKGLDSKRNSQVSDIANTQDQDNHSFSADMKECFKNMPSEMKWELIRPKSDEFGFAENSADVGLLSGSNLRKDRSLSMPLLSDIQAMLQQLDTSRLAELRQPYVSPIYLPAFKPSRPKKQFKLNPKRVKGRERSMSVSMVTNMLPFMEDEDSTLKSDLVTVKEEPPIIPTPTPEPPVLPPTPEPPTMDEVRTPTPLSLQLHTQPDAAPPAVPPQPVVRPPSPLPSPDKSPPKRREIVKKEKKVRPPPPPKPVTPVRDPTPTPAPPPREETPVTSREVSLVFEKEPYKPELPPIEIPDLPKYQEKQVSHAPKTKSQMKLIEVTPELPEAKKKLPPPPKLAPRVRQRGPPRRSRVAEAPVTPGELQQLSDPLDFLAKYCIINPDRLPFYERVFNGAVFEQTPRYSRNEGPRPGAMVSLPPAQLSEHELNMLRDLTVLSHAQSPRREGLSAPEQYLEKLNYTVEFIKGKVDVIQQHMAKLQGEKLSYMARVAKEMDRDIAKLDYKVTGKKKKKKKKKKKADVVDYDQVGAMSGDMKDFKPARLSDITDEVIVSRMSDNMMKKVKKDPVVKKLSLEISRDIEKLKNFDQRIAQIEDEKDLVGLYCMDYYFSEQADPSNPQQFRRQQSRLYQKLHPNPDIEMNMEEVEAALQQINNRLLTDNELHYIYFVLELPKREKINFRLFSIIAALSEKVTQMDPAIRKLINKQDYKALDVKMGKSKELFDLLQDADLMPAGNAPADNLAVELTAGGLTPEHTNYVLSKFDRKGQGFCDFLDFVMYVPLFIQIHKRIVDDPFNDSLDV